MSNNTLTLTLSPTIKIADPAVTEICDRIVKYQQLFSPGRDEPYRLAGYEDLFVCEPKELLAYDNYAESDTRWLGFDRYRQIWEREINQNFPGFVMYLVEVDRIEVSGDMAWTAFTWYGHVTTSTGQLWPAQHATHGWRRMDGTWRIVHEHLTSGVKEAGLLVETGRTPAVSSADRVVRHSRQRLVARSH